MPGKLLKESPSQTAGPYIHIGMAPPVAGLPVRADETPNVLAGPRARGERIRIEGRVFDGEGAPVKDAIIEVWQADANGIYDHPADQRNIPPDPDFRNFGRAVCDLKSGHWSIDSVKPGPVPGPPIGSKDGGSMAPHISIAIFARGINIHLNSRIYFDDEADANEADPILALVEPARRDTLIARRGARDGQAVYHFDIRLQGDDETVFFDV
ncbi:MAG: protocatechuate 3,4-dioxygenase subunit alpha [Kiloniellales bacterium]